MPVFNIVTRNMTLDGSREWVESFTVESPDEEYAIDVACEESTNIVAVDSVEMVPGTEDICTWEWYDMGMCQ